MRTVRELTNLITQVGKAILTIIVGLVIFMIINWIYMYFHLQPTTDMSDYKDILDDWKQKDLVKHFPKDVDDDNSQNKLFFQPGFLQGGTRFEVLVKLNEKLLNEKITKFNEAAIYIEKGDCQVRHDDYYIPRGFNTFKLTEEFKTFVFYSKSKDDSVMWNHGQSSGVSVNEKSGTVVYWAES